MKISYFGAILIGFAITMLIPPTDESLKLLWVMIFNIGLMLSVIGLIISYMKYKEENAEHNKEVKK